jgi:hypothetical protein
MASSFVVYIFGSLLALAILSPFSPFGQCPHVRLQTLPTPSVVNIALPFAQRSDKALVYKILLVLSSC